MRPSQTTNEKHLKEPMVGDYWHEMYCPALVVLGVSKKGILIICRKVKHEADSWSWDFDKAEFITKQELSDFVRYDHLKDACRCDVVPQHHFGAAKYLRRSFHGKSTARFRLEGRQMEFKIWFPDRGETESDALTVEGIDAEDACQIFCDRKRCSDFEFLLPDETIIAVLRAQDDELHVIEARAEVNIDIRCSSYVDDDQREAALKTAGVVLQ